MIYDFDYWKCFKNLLDMWLHLNIIERMFITETMFLWFGNFSWSWISFSRFLDSFFKSFSSANPRFPNWGSYCRPWITFMRYFTSSPTLLKECLKLRAIFLWFGNFSRSWISFTRFFGLLLILKNILKRKSQISNSREL